MGREPLVVDVNISSDSGEESEALWDVHNDSSEESSGAEPSVDNNNDSLDEESEASVAAPAAAPDGPAPTTDTVLCTDPPFNWTKKRWSGWRDRNPWLFTKNKKLGCAVCKAAKSLLQSERVNGVHMSEEWMSGEVSSVSQNNLRKKLYKHRDSLAHKRHISL